MDVDTIVALSTAPGVGAIAVVRLSGPRAFGILEALVPGYPADRVPPRTATVARLVSPADGSVLDQALVTRFPGPDSYTGEDVVEIACHGGLLVPHLVVEACRTLGARPAEPGEFTRRAYLRGRLDLVQAEAIGDLIHARSRALHRAAVDQLDRGLSERIGALREALVHLGAMLAHHIDFPEEDDAPVPLDRILAEAESLELRLGRMIATAPEGELLRSGALVVLAGKPNVGKSSLYNALLGTDRAIVTAEAGTTRDALESSLEMGGYPFRLVDTAGLREASGEVEALGIEVTRRYLADADLVLLCVEAGVGPGSAEALFLEDVADRPVVYVETKCDECEGGSRGPSPLESGLEGVGLAGFSARVRVSVRTGAGLDELRWTLPNLVYSGVVEAENDAPVITRRRHAHALTEARAEMVRFREAVSRDVPAEIAALHLSGAEAALEEVLGVVSTDDVLDVVFREFCVGK